MELATKIFEIAEQRDKEVLTRTRENFLHVVELYLENLLKEFKSWEDKEHKFTFQHFRITNFNSLERATKNLGFILKESLESKKEDCFYLSIPRQIEGERKNCAQEMLYQFEQKLEKHIDSEKSRAKTECEKIIELLEIERFKSYFYDENQNSKSFKISVDTSSRSLSISQPFLNELKRLLEIRGFYNLSFNSCIDTWDFVVRK